MVHEDSVIEVLVPGMLGNVHKEHITELLVADIQRGHPAVPITIGMTEPLNTPQQNNGKQTSEATAKQLGTVRTDWLMVLRISHMFYNIKVMKTSIGSLELAALITVARLGDDAYGLAVRRDLLTRTGRDNSVGAIYTTLRRLEDKGLLKSRSSEPLPVRGGRSRRHFVLTGAGARAMREAERSTAALWSGLGSPRRPEPA
jgi:Predicted transcriptional regulators